VSEFFEPPAPPPEPEPEPRQTPWFGPPGGTLPGVVALELVLAQTERVAVYVAQLLSYPTGFAFDVIAVSAPGTEEELDPLLFGRHYRRRPRSEEISPEMLRLGVQFSDGTKATNTSGRHFDSDPPPGPVMQPAGGHGGGGSSQQTFWVWPLPPSGPLSFVCEWPVAEIALTRQQLDAQIILDAASRAQVLFPDHPPQGHIYGGVQGLG